MQVGSIDASRLTPGGASAVVTARLCEAGDLYQAEF